MWSLSDCKVCNRVCSGSSILIFYLCFILFHYAFTVQNFDLYMVMLLSIVHAALQQVGELIINLLTRTKKCPRDDTQKPDAYLNFYLVRTSNYSMGYKTKCTVIQSS